MKSCVFFAVSVDYADKLYVVREYLDMLQKHFSDCKIFIGVNYNSHNDIEDIVKSYSLNYQLKRLQDETFHVNSDASAYQLCLQMLTEDEEKYDVAWFMHTKGGFNPRDDGRAVYINNFFPKRHSIEKKFEQFPKLGVYGYRCGGYMWFNHDNNICKQNTEKFVRDVWDTPSSELFPNTFCEMIIIETMFAINTEVLYKYIEMYPEVLTTPFNRIVIGRWFVEMMLSNTIPTRMGYFPMVMSYEDWTQPGISFKDKIIDWVGSWIKTNKLHHLTDYMRLYYEFDTE